MQKYRKYILFIIIILVTIEVYPNKPHVINMYREKYHADNKNWSIGQDERGTMYFGNDAGLLDFDGVEWNLNRLPNSQVLRSLAVLSHQTIFTGSYEEFGRWDRDVSGKLIYTSLSDGLDKDLFKNDDFWKIWIAEDCVYFQSFSYIYVYDYKTTKRIPSEKGFLLLTKVRNEFIVQQMRGSLFRLKGQELSKIEGSDIFINTDVRVILPYLKDKYLIGTTTKGIYLYDGYQFIEWNSNLSAIMNSTELNCGIQTTKGSYYLGTILDGIYEVDINGRIVDHISSENNLQNNTILSLYEDNLGNVWAALDRGLAYIQYIENMSCYTDPRGSTGAVYCAAIWDGKLFIGTNQGVFYIPRDGLDKPNTLANMRLIDGTQGQTWNLKVINDILYCCHNRGLKEIRKDLTVIDVGKIGVGIYNILESKIRNRDYLILSTYQSIKILDPKTKDVFSPGQISEPIINAQFDHLGNLWLEHFNRGVYRCKLEDDLSGFRTFSYYGGSNKDGLPYKLRIFKVGGRIMLLGNNQFYTYDDIQNKIIPSILLDRCFENIKNIKQVIPINDNTFWALTSTSIYKFSFDGYEASIIENYDLGMNLAMVNSYENISILNNSTSLICLDNGFLLYDNEIDKKKTDLYKELPTPYLESLQTVSVEGNIKYENLLENTRISYDYNTVTFEFSSNYAFASNLSFQYMIENVDKDWSTPQRIDHISYARLPAGEYTFLVRTVDDLGNWSPSVSYTFEILSPWYLTVWAYILYILLIIVIMYTVWMLILKQYRNHHLQKIRLRETKRLRALTGELQLEVEQKNAELFTQTSFIIQKNELILKIKDIVDEFYAKNKINALLPLYQKINALLNNNMNSEDDWKMFLIKFEEKHTGFFKKMKVLYPQLTNSDLRLCACLKLNLETKEIASLMNLSVRAIENSRYRLRKKLNIQPSQNLNEFFLNID